MTNFDTAPTTDESIADQYTNEFNGEFPILTEDFDEQYDDDDILVSMANGEWSGL